MSMQKVEFEFPDDDEKDIEVEPNKMETIDVENPKSHLDKKDDEVEVEIDDKGGKVEAKKKSEPKVEDDDLDLEIVDDTPKADRGRKPSDPPEDPTEDELETYSEKVRNRIKHFTKGYHDERRAKEAAERERLEAVELTQRLLDENRRLKESGSKSQSALLKQAQHNANQAYANAKTEYKKAYDNGNSDEVLEAHEKLTEAKLKVDKLANVKIPPLQKDDDGVNVNSNTSKPVNQQEASTEVRVDEKAANWAKENTWFQKDPEMTSFAIGVHERLINEGTDPQSDTYYERLNARMRQVFPERFDETEEKPKQKQSNGDNVVAPATRSTAPRKVRLTQSQVRLAKRLGLTPEEYAKQVALEMRKSNG